MLSKLCHHLLPRTSQLSLFQLSDLALVQLSWQFTLSLDTQGVAFGACGVNLLIESVSIAYTWPQTDRNCYVTSLHPRVLSVSCQSLVLHNHSVEMILF